MFISTAYALSGIGGGEGGGDIWDFVIPFVIIIAIFYFLIIRPQRKKAKEHQEMIDNIQKGDIVVTSGGLRGKVMGFSDGGKIVKLKVGDDTVLDVIRVRIEIVGKLPEEVGEKK
jgi:preprotein translocase subunit YajC